MNTLADTAPLPGAPQPSWVAAPAPCQSPAGYTLALPRDGRLRLARGWLWLAMLALVGSGVFSVLLVRIAHAGHQHLAAGGPTSSASHVVVHVVSVGAWCGSPPWPACSGASRAVHVRRAWAGRLLRCVLRERR